MRGTLETETPLASAVAYTWKQEINHTAASNKALHNEWTDGFL